MNNISISKNLPPIRGTYAFDVELSKTSWFRVGGLAEVVFQPADEDDLAGFLKHCPHEVPITVLGALSNTIIRDGGIRGIVIRLGREFANIAMDDTIVTVGAGVNDVVVARETAMAGLSGLEFLIGIPGTIGGAIRMNAGAVGGPFKDVYGQTSMRDVLITATAIDRAGTIHTVTGDDMHLTYRHNDAPDDWIFTRTTFRTTRGDPTAILAHLEELKEKRALAQPVKSRTGGSTFANPSVAELNNAHLPPETRTWQLIDQAGCRGLTVGGAQMSAHHCNFMINTGTATAYDLEALGELVRTRVYDQFGITLRWEIKRLGDFAEGQTGFKKYGERINA